MEIMCNACCLIVEILLPIIQHCTQNIKHLKMKVRETGNLTTVMQYLSLSDLDTKNRR